MKYNNLITGLLALLVSTSAMADSINFSGTIADSTSGDPVAQSNLKFDAKVKSGSCVLYEEIQSGIDMSNSAGRFSLNIGEGNKVGSNTFQNVFVVGQASCADGSNLTLDFSSPKSVDIVVTAQDGSNVATMSNLPLKNAGASLNSKTLNGKSDSSFIQTSVNITQAAIEALASGASTLYAKAADTATSLASYYKKTEVDGLLATKADKTQLKALAGKDKADYTADLINVPTTFAPSAHTHVIADVTGLSSALDGKLNSSSIAQCGSAGQTMIWTAAAGYSCVNSTPDYANVLNKPTLGTSAALNVGVASNNVVQLDASGKLPAVDGSALKNVVPTWAQQATPAANPATGANYLYFKADDNLYMKNSAGTETKVSGGSSSSSGSNPIFSFQNFGSSGSNVCHAFDSTCFNSGGVTIDTASGWSYNDWSYTIPADGVYQVSAQYIATYINAKYSSAPTTTSYCQLTVGTSSLGSSELYIGKINHSGVTTAQINNTMSTTYQLTKGTKVFVAESCSIYVTGTGYFNIQKIN